MNSENTIVIDDRRCSFQQGETILQVAQRNGIHIPTLCHLKGASPTGACRICLVEVEKARNLVASCAAPAVNDMIVKTGTPRVVKVRNMNIEFLLASGHHNCFAQDMDPDSWTDFQLRAMETKGHEDLCPAYGDCRLQELAVKYQIKTGRFMPVNTRFPIEDVNPFIVRDFSRCILCGRCVQACNEIQVNNAISLGYRGSSSKIVTKGDMPLKDSDCVFCGECVQVCPVGALITKHEFRSERSKGETEDAKKIRTTCSYCGVGCQIYLHVIDDTVVKVTGVDDVPPNYGSLCVKGRFGFDFIHHQERLTTPMIRKNGELKDASWDEALDIVAEKMKQIKKESGPDSIGVLTSARISNEENYLAQKFTRAVIGTNNVDHCARL